MRAFVKNVVGAFDISPQGTHIAMITYGDRSQTAFTFPIDLKTGARYDKQTVNAFVNAAPRSTGRTRNINMAFGDAVQLFTNRLYGARKNSRKVMALYIHLFELIISNYIVKLRYVLD